ncbi:MAG: beta-lactamase family protein [Clostridia bacterium]|nr:beta-lactamase family protein [Clostridia bacterium]
MIQKKYQEILDAYVKNGHAAGCAVLLYRDGEELAYASAGVRELGRPDPFTRDTVMLMYSMTKVVTAAAVMTLWDKGILTPETPVCEFFPEFADMDVVNPDGTLRKAENVMRVKHLLTMTSGIPYHWDGGVVGESVRAMLAEMEGMRAEEVTTLALVRRIGKCPLMFEPGTAYLYGLSADVLGGVVEIASGMGFGEYLRKTIFDPLGMHDTAFRPLPHMADRVARKYSVDENGSYTPSDIYMGVPAIDRSPSVEMGGSGLYSTLDDYMRFGEMLRCGGMGIIREETVREMAKNQLPACISAEYVRNNGGYGYGYLVRSLVNETPDAHGEGIGAFGWGGMAGTDLRIDPARGYTMVWGIQRFPGTCPIGELLDAMG